MGRRGSWWTCVVLGGLLVPVGAFAGQGGCNVPVQGNAASFGAASVLAGERVIAVMRDCQLQSKWGVVANAVHPEWPVRMVLLSEGTRAVSDVSERRSAKPIAKTPLMVRAGEVVRLWRQDAMTRLEMAGRAEENGQVGRQIRVMILAQAAEGQGAETHVAGIVRGPGNVEMVQ